MVMMTSIVLMMMMMMMVMMIIVIVNTIITKIELELCGSAETSLGSPGTKKFR